MIRQVTIGKKKTPWSVSMRMSPGKRPRPSLESHGHRSPTSRRPAPITINIRCIFDIVLQGERLEKATIREYRTHECASRSATFFARAGGLQGWVPGIPY